MARKYPTEEIKIKLTNFIRTSPVDVVAGCWAEIADQISVSLIVKTDFAASVLRLASELKAAVDAKDWPKIEEIANEIEGTTEENSLLVKLTILDPEDQETRKLTATIAVIYETVAYLYKSNKVFNIPSYLKEDYELNSTEIVGFVADQARAFSYLQGVLK